MISKNRPKGLTSIRSMSGMVTETTHPHRKFLRLAILAMEQMRRSTEKNSAQHRIDGINERLEEIRTESVDILRACNDVVKTESGEAPVALKEAESPPRRGFALKY